MLKNIIFTLFIAVLSSWGMYSYAENTPPAQVTLTPSPIQANGSIIPILESSINSYLRATETQALEYGLNLTIDGQPIIQTPSIEYLTNYNRYYCNPNSQYDNNLPESCPATNNDSTINLYGDLRTSILFNSLNYSTVDSTGNYLTTAKAAVNSIIDPFPDATLNSLLSSRTSAADPKNQEKIATLIAKQAPLMMAKNSLNGIIARRILPDSNQRPSLPANFAKTIMQIIQGESERRLTDSTWFGNLEQYSTNQLLTELLEIEAFKLWMEYNKFQQNERIEALLATLLAVHSNGTTNAIPKAMVDKLINQIDNTNQQTQQMQNNLPTIPTIPGPPSQ